MLTGVSSWLASSAKVPDGATARNSPKVTLTTPDGICSKMVCVGIGTLTLSPGDFFTAPFNSAGSLAKIGSKWSAVVSTGPEGCGAGLAGAAAAGAGATGLATGAGAGAGVGVDTGAGCLPSPLPNRFFKNPSIGSIG